MLTCRLSSEATTTEGVIMSKVSLLTAIVAAFLATLAGTASPAAAAPTAPSAPAAASVGTLDLQFVLEKVVVRGKKLVAQGELVGTVKTASGTQVVRKPFAAPVRSITRSKQSVSRANRICDVLNLNLAPLRLELLGLIVELDRVILNIRANSRGGLLGSLLCSLAGRPLTAQANRLNRALLNNGVSAVYGITLPLVPVTLGGAPGAAALPPVPAGHCTVLDLVLGPLNLNLLGLIVELNRVQLRITANPAGGLLGSLLCGLAGGGPAST
jgi:hypothetical protein